MSTKSDLLEKLTFEQLKEIALVEGIEFPNGITKSELIERMLKLSIRRIKEHVVDYTEDTEETEDMDYVLSSPEEPSLLWYLAPLFFGIIGGLIGYVGVKDRDPEMAFDLMKWGLVTTGIAILLVLLYIRPTFSQL